MDAADSGGALPEAAMTFRGGGAAETQLPLSALRAACPASRVEVADPYHEKPMRYFAWPFVCVLDAGFASLGGSEALRGQNLLLRALDGYTRPAPGSQLLEAGAMLAFGEAGLMSSDRDRPRFSTIRRAGANPGPYYLIWDRSGQNDPHTHPWPYQLATIELARFEAAFPHTVPSGLSSSDAGWSGYALFQQNCAACHSINGEGGKVGPELNVPQSIVEYRPIAQIKRYIRNPEATRYTNMPAHPGLSDADLSDLVAYFRAMAERKHDPRRSAE